MAEGEVKSEKKTIEMSVWFIMLLIVIIIAGTMVMSLNSRIKNLELMNSQLTKQVTQLEEEKTNKTKLILDLVVSQVEGAQDKQALINELRDALDQKEKELIGTLETTEGISGEEVAE